MRTSKKEFGKTVLLLIAIAIISVWMANFAYDLQQTARTYDLKEINATFTIGNAVGFAVDQDVLNFGIVYPGGSSTKEITLYHNYTKPLMAKFEYKGTISRVIDSIEPMYLEPGVEKIVRITAYARYANNETFTGVVRVIYLKP